MAFAGVHVVSRLFAVGDRTVSTVLEFSVQGYEGKPRSIDGVDMAFSRHEQAAGRVPVCLPCRKEHSGRKSVSIFHADIHDRNYCKFPVLACVAFSKPLRLFFDVLPVYVGCGFL